MATNTTIWIDLDNSPHVPLFVPIIREFERRGYRILVTTRDCFQVCGLADYHGLKHRTFGRHYGANKALKVLGTIWRSIQLIPLIIRERPSVSISHGSRSMILLSSLMNIPTVLMFDYEHSTSLPFLKPVLGLAPEAINSSELSKHFKNGLRSYEGLKEDVYVQSFTPDPALRQKLGISTEEVLVTIRPPATEAHYHNPLSERLFLEVVNVLSECKDVRMVILPRHEQKQRDLVYDTWPELCAKRTIIVPDVVVDGLNLIWNSDLVVSAGGTMNREAAALGVPVYSIFRGKIGAVDRYLAERGRLTLVETCEQVRTQIRPVKRIRDDSRNYFDKKALGQIVAALEEVIPPKTPAARELLAVAGPSKRADR